MQVGMMLDGGDLTARALLYRPPSTGLLNYLNNKINRAVELTGEYGTRFIDATRNLYNQYNSLGAINAAKSIMYSLGGHSSELVLQRLSEDNYNPNLLMQRYIMTSPAVADKHQKNMCNGFQDTYFDMEPGIYGKDRYEYRQVMDGVLYHDDEGDGWINYYTEMVTENDEELEAIDKFTILDAWDLAANMIAKGKDPTNLDQE